MIKTNIVIDGSYLLYKSVFMLKKTKTIDLDLENLLHIELNKLIRSYDYDNIYFVSDMGSSWRKEIFQTYKQDRKKDESIDWKTNINKYEFPKIEGDDIIAFIVNKSNELGYSNIIIGNDKDLHQLIKFDINKKYINILWNYKMSDGRVYFPENYQIFFNSIKNEESAEIDLFDEDYFDADFIEFLNGLINQTKLTEINNEESLFIKIIHGDNSDKIPSIYKKNNRGIGETGAKKIYKLYKEIYPDKIEFNNDDFLMRVVEIVSYDKKLEDLTEQKVIFLNAKDNRKLIKLDKEYMPTHLNNMLVNFVKID